MLVYADAQALQNPVTVERGIGRYVTELSVAVEHNHPGAIDGWILRSDRPVPVHTPSLIRAARYRMQEDPRLRAPDIWYQSSPFESLEEPVDTLWPIWARSTRTRLVTTLYDLIPLIYSDQYLADPATRRVYTARLEFIRHSDKILAISEATAQDAVRLLGIPARKFAVVGTGVSESFVPATSPEHALASARVHVPGLRDGYVMYTGGIDFRKNIDGLLVAYSLLPAAVRAQHQLVIVCRVQPSEREHLEREAAALGIEADFLLTGFVPNSVLLWLYQAAHLFVFPSLYEGFGLPVVEALSCGIPAIVGANSSLTEIVLDPRAHFDASSPSAICAALLRALTDDELRESLRRNAMAGDHKWSAVAERTLEAFERTAVKTPKVGSKPRVAFVTPMPPAASGVADYSMAILEHMCRRAKVDVFTNGDAVRTALPGVTWYGYHDFPSVERIYGMHDARIIALGNSEFHVEALGILTARGGTVMSHDVRYTGLLGLALRDRPELVDARARELLKDLYAGRRPLVHQDHVSIRPSDYYTLNGLLCEPAASPASAVLVHSEVAAMLARANLPAAQHRKVQVVPFGHTLRKQDPTVLRDTVASFGIVHWQKESVTVCRAFLELAPRHPGTTFALVGRAVDADTRQELEEMIAGSGFAHQVVLTGRVAAKEYDDWLARTKLAVQLRLHSNGETSAAVADCLGASIPVVTSNTGALAALKHCAHLVEPGIGVQQLVDVVELLLDDDQGRERLALRGRAHAEANSFATAADAVLDIALSS